MPLIPLFIQSEINADAASRLSAFNFCNPFDYILPPSDGTIAAVDRQHLWGLYSGIAAGTPVPPLPPTEFTQYSIGPIRIERRPTFRAIGSFLFTIFTFGSHS